MFTHPPRTPGSAALRPQNVLAVTVLLACSLTWMGAAQAAELTFTPVADAYVRQDLPSSNFGTGTTLNVDNRPVQHIFLKFVVTGVGAASVSNATLMLYNVDSSTHGGTFFRVADSSWQETTVTWQNAPPADATALASLGSVSVGRWYQVDLTSMITRDGTYSLRITSSSSNGADFASRERGATTAPQLKVTLGGAGHALTVGKVGSGTVVSTPAGINCGATCSTSFPDGTAVTLTATAASGWAFETWSGDCTGRDPCTVTMSVDHAVTAQFIPLQGAVSFAAAGDHGANSAAAASLATLDASGVQFYLALGDLDYDETSSDAAWCDYVMSRLPTLGPTFPFELVAGNHEEQGGPDGYILNHAACLPHRLGTTLSSPQQYGAEYYFDAPSSSPLVRVILISPGLTVEDVTYSYNAGTSHHQWLAQVIDEARGQGIPWVVVGMHMICISTGPMSCGTGNDLMNLLIGKKVDLVLHAHERNYQRSRQLALNPSTCPAMSTENFRSGCIVDDGADGTYTQGAGTVLVIAGTFGQTLRSLDSSDPEAGYFAATSAASHGIVRYAVTRDRLEAQFLPSSGSFTDRFSIVSTQPPAEDTDAPSATITSPAAGATVSGTVNVLVSASDDTGVSRVELAVDGASPVTDSSAPYSFSWNTTTVTNGSHTLLARAFDAAGNVGNSSVTVTVDNSVRSVLEFTPDADTFVQGDKSSTNFGTSTEIAVDSSPQQHGLIRIVVSGVGSRRVESARLRLFCVNSSARGGDFFVVPSDTWQESTVTWANAPAASSSAIASVGAVTSGSWVDVDVTSLVTADGTYSLRITTPSSDGVDYTSREGATASRPRLVVTLAPQ
ncbi:MAG: DNRLRE domain-containing protein [Myxococcota bacterium]